MRFPTSVIREHAGKKSAATTRALSEEITTEAQPEANRRTLLSKTIRLRIFEVMVILTSILSKTLKCRKIDSDEKYRCN